MFGRKFRSAGIRCIYVSQEVSLCGARYFSVMKSTQKSVSTRRPYNLSTQRGDSDTYIFSGLYRSLWMKFSAIIPQHVLDPKIFRPSVL